MFELQGFIAVDGMANASPSNVSIIGEISQNSLTYSRGYSEYASDTLPYRLYGFYSKTALGYYNAPSELVTQIWNITDWLFTKQKSNNPANTVASLIAALAANFTSNVQNIEMGSLLNAGGFVFPEYVQWTNLSIATNDDESGAKVKIWFSDQSFQIQYSKYEHIVVAPFSNIDDFLLGYNSVKTNIDAIAPSEYINNIATVTQGYPSTTVVALDFDYVDPNNSNNTITTSWAVVVYGKAGTNVDHCKASIRDFIAENSSHDEASWREIFPSLYITIEFLIYPRWRDYAIQELIGTQGAYDSAVKPAKQLNYLKSFLTNYPQDHIDDYTVILPINYRSLMLLIVPSVDNNVDYRDFTLLYNDIMNVPTTDPLYNQMRLITRNWLRAIVEMSILAETATTQTILPAEMSLVARGNILYIEKSINGIQYLIATKNTVPVYA